MTWIPWKLPVIISSLPGIRLTLSVVVSAGKYADKYGKYGDSSDYYYGSSKYGKDYEVSTVANRLYYNYDNNKANFC